MSTHQRQLWDIAGVDGLQAARDLFGAAIDRLAPFQSLETRLMHQDCSVLRLCEQNFRLAWQGTTPGQVIQQVQQHRAWIKQFPWLSPIVLSAADLTHLIHLAVPKPPHRLQGLADGCAAPARIANQSVLIWRHSIAGQAAIELHIATTNRAIIHSALSPFLTVVPQ